MKAVKLLNNTMPKNPGEYSIQDKMYRPPYGERTEIFMQTPHVRTGALIPEKHIWSFDEKDRLTVSPSIVYFDYHGFLIKDEWS